MARKPVIGIIDVGKTNKKLLLFDDQYGVVHEQSDQLPESVDEDNFPCEDLGLLLRWLEESLAKSQNFSGCEVKAFNFSSYGATFVHLGEADQPVSPIYNYLKPYPEEIKRSFYQVYGGEEKISLETASPVLGNLNSGMQLYWLKRARPEVYQRIRHSLHLPQYLSFLLTGKKFSDLTSIGCHTALWDFRKHDYHEWVYREGINEKFPSIVRSDAVIDLSNHTFRVGVGLHDSSAALIPYLLSFREPFLLISTGTWCITLNPFNSDPLTAQELSSDCLCYLSYEGRPVKAARLFAGNERETQARRIATHFNVSEDYYKRVQYAPDRVQSLRDEHALEQALSGNYRLTSGTESSAFGGRNLNDFFSVEDAYHQLMLDIIVQQIASVRLVLNDRVGKIFVDGGFSKNPIYMNLLACAFPHLEVYAASVAQASALGAALAIHGSWNSHPVPDNLIALKLHRAQRSLI